MSSQDIRNWYRAVLLYFTVFLSAVLMGFLYGQIRNNVFQADFFVRIVVQGLATTVSLLVVVVSIDLGMENLRNTRQMARNERRIKYLEEQIEFYSRIQRNFTKFNPIDIDNQSKLKDILDDIIKLQYGYLAEGILEKIIFESIFFIENSSLSAKGAPRPLNYVLLGENVNRPPRDLEVEQKELVCRTFLDTIERVVHRQFPGIKKIYKLYTVEAQPELSEELQSLDSELIEAFYTRT